MNWNAKKTTIAKKLNNIELEIIAIKELLEMPRTNKIKDNDIIDFNIIKSIIQNVNGNDIKDISKRKLTEWLINSKRWNYGFNKTLMKIDHFTKTKELFVERYGQKLLYRLPVKGWDTEAENTPIQKTDIEFDTPNETMEKRREERFDRQQKEKEYKASVDNFISNYPSIIEITIRIQTSTKEKYEEEREQLKLAFIKTAIEDGIDNPEEQFNNIQYGLYLD